MKMSIEWHKNCAENRGRYIKERETEIKRLQSSLDYTKKEHAFCLLQIKKAVKAKKDSFDRDRYLTKLK